MSAAAAVGVRISRPFYRGRSSLAQTADRPASLPPLSTHRCCRRSPAAPLLPIDIALRLNKVTQDILRRGEWTREGGKLPR